MAHGALTPHKLYFRCVNFRVETALVQRESVSDVEEHFLRAVLAGFDTLDDIQALLGGLPLRMSMEAVNGMVRRNLLVMDFRTGRFHVPRAVRTALLAEGALEGRALAGGQQYGQTRPFALCLNRCTGGVTLGRRSLRRLSFVGKGEEPPETVFPTDRTVDVSDLDLATMVTRIDAAVRRNGLAVRDVDLAGAQVLEEGGLLAQVFPLEWGDDPDDASVTLQFDPDQRASAREISELEAAVLATRRHKPWFWQRLRPRRLAAGEPVSAGGQLRSLPESPAAMAARLERSGSEVLDASAVSEELSRLSAMLDRAERVRALVGPASVVEAVQGVLAGRRRQALLVCPFIDMRHAAGLLATPGASEGRSARIGVAWGIEAVPYDPPDGLDSLQASADVVLGGGASVHAKLAVQDAERTVLTTKNFLSSGPGSPLFDVGIVMEGGPLTAEALEWASRIVPPSLALRWSSPELPNPVAARGGYSLPPAEDVPADLDALVAAVDALTPDDDGSPEPVRALTSAIEAWWREGARGVSNGGQRATASRASVARVARLVAQRLDDRGHAPCNLVTTAEHRPMMFDALERARQWVVICSHRVGRRPLGPNWQHALGGALDRGVNVVLLWGEEAEDVEGQHRQLQQLSEIAEGRRGQFTVNRSPLRTHCKLLIIDGTASIVTSFEFLHFINSQAYTRHELGVWLGSERVARELLAGLQAHVAAVDGDLARRLASMTAPGAPRVPAR